MPVRELNREQSWLLPPSLDELIQADHPARFVAAFVDALDIDDWQKLNIKMEGEALGAPCYHPRALTAVWLYGFMTGTRSSRKLEAACRDQMPYLWLTGWQHPDHNSLWRFYKAHRDEMRHFFKLSIKTAVKMDLVDLAVQAIDGTKIAANASKSRSFTVDGLEKLLARTEEAILKMEKENETGNDPPPCRLPDKLREKKLLTTKVKTAMETLAKDESRKQVNLTDGDANLMKSRQGIVAGYNLEAAASLLKNSGLERPGRLLTAVEVVQDANDAQQLIPMIDQARENTGQAADIALADAGFHSGAVLSACRERGQVVVMPEGQQRALQQLYHKDKFVYDPEMDSYRCPCGENLKFIQTKLARHTLMRVYRGNASICRNCKAFGKCTKNARHGRELQVGENEADLRRHREWMNTEEAKIAYSHRQGLIEPNFGIIKEQMGIHRFLLRGLSNVRAESMVLATAFNLRTLYWVWKRWSATKRREFTGYLPNNGFIPKKNMYFILNRSRHLVPST
jgi:transposase